MKKQYKIRIECPAKKYRKNYSLSFDVQLNKIQIKNLTTSKNLCTRVPVKQNAGTFRFNMVEEIIPNSPMKVPHLKLQQEKAEHDGSKTKFRQRSILTTNVIKKFTV